MKAMYNFYFAVFVAFLLGTSGRGMADEDICVHGHSAQSQTPHSAPIYYGWGITLEQPSHDGNWLHYSIPTYSGKSLKAIKVKFSTGVNGFIDAIHIWDGDAPKVELEHLHLKGSETKVVPLTPEQPFTSVGVSIKVKADPGEDAHVLISSVCATFSRRTLNTFATQPSISIGRRRAAPISSSSPERLDTLPSLLPSAPPRMPWSDYNRMMSRWSLRYRRISAGICAGAPDPTSWRRWTAPTRSVAKLSRSMFKGSRTPCCTIPGADYKSLQANTLPISKIDTCTIRRLRASTRWFPVSRRSS